MGVAMSFHMRSTSAFLVALVLYCCTLGVNCQLTSCGAASAGPVLNGIDIVDAFQAAKAGHSAVPQKGSPANNYTDSAGFTFYFISAANAASYKASPSSYPVGAGGYCGLAVSGGDPACG